MNELKVDLNATKLKKLHKGSGVIIKPEQIGSGHSVMIGKVKLNKLMKGKEKGKGTKLQLSAEEIKKNSKEGDGLFSKLLMKEAKVVGKKVIGKMKSKAKEKVKEVAVKQGKKLAQKGVDKLAKKAGEKNEVLGKVVGDLGSKAVEKGAEMGAKKLDQKIGNGKVRKPRTIKKEVITFENEGDGFKDMVKKLAKQGYDKYGDEVKRKAKEVAVKHGRKIAKKGVSAVANKASARSKMAGDFIQEHGDMLVDKVAEKAGGSFRPYGRFLRKAGKKSGKYALPVAAGAAGDFIGGPVGATALTGITGDLTKGWGVQDTTQIQFGRGMDEHGNPLVAGNYSNFLPETSAYIPKGALNVNQTISGYAQHGSGIYSSRGNGLYSGNGLYTSRRHGNGAPIPQGTYDSYAV